MPRIPSPILLILAALVLALIGAGAAAVTAHKPDADPGGISTAALSRCAGLAGREIREADPSFGELRLDGLPWLSAQHGLQVVVLNSTGSLRRRNGTIVPFRFLCLLEDSGRASMFRIVATGVDEASPSARLVAGVAVPAGLEPPLPRGAELRVQLLDITTNPKGEVVAEQLVRSGWQVPVPFSLRVSADALTEDRRFAIAARVVLARATIYRMERPRVLTPVELQRPLVLELPAESPADAR
jgi:hypothetical protein